MGDIGNSITPDPWYEAGIKNKENIYMPVTQSQQLSLQWKANDAALITALQKQNISIVSVIFSGRPVVLKDVITKSDAVIAAFLPGTLGGNALANAMFGDYRFRHKGFSNTLTFPWPRNMNDVIKHFADGNLFPMGFGLST